MTKFTQTLFVTVVAAIGQLGSIASGPAVAEDTANTEAVVQVAAVTAAAIGDAYVVADAGTAERGAAERRASRIERRCERTERIGKFTISRCD
jgi:hypothetical protein